MKVRRIAFLAAIAAVLIAFVSGCHRRPWGDNLSERVLDRLDSHVEDFDLTDEQNTTYQEVKKRLEADLNKTQAEHKAFKLKLQELLKQDDANVKQITSELRFKLDEMPEKLTIYLDYMDELWDILDQQQQETLMTEIRDKTENKRWNRRHHRYSEKKHQRMLKRIDNRIEDLNLDEAQTAKYLDLRARLEKEISSKKENHNEFRTRMKQLIENENTGVKELTAELRIKLNQMPDKVSVYLDYVDEMWDILNEDQQATVMEEIRDKADFFLD